MEYKTKTNSKISPKKMLISIVIMVISALVLTSGFFVYKYFFPSNIELLILANLNTYNESQNQTEPESFTRNTNVSFETDGDFTNQDAAEAFDTFKISLCNEKESEISGRYTVGIDFMGRRFFESELVRNGNTEVFTVPQLSEVSYASDSYTDVLSLLLGSEKPQEIGIYDSVDKNGFKKIYGKYLKRLYDNVPKNDISVVEENNIKTLTLKTNFNRLVYEILEDVKEDVELRDFTYEQKKIIYDNVNKKIPYAGTLMTLEEKKDFDEKFYMDLSDFISDTEDSSLTIVAKISDRKILEETIEIGNEKEIQFMAEYSKENLKILNVDGGKVKLDLNIDSTADESGNNKNMRITFDINDFTKEKSTEQKLLTYISEERTLYNSVKDIVMPKEFTDIRNISDAEKEKITETASKNFTEILTTLTFELFF